ncbi:hypothetical protein MSTO_22240 [Mycobacterium stomatepiae]|uniref:NADP-dependent oxidoreductase domain-containing protein n=1 Tax=Mycobacterium stomatepiae TaxID=470076 RepID=A0A7I7Q6W3_9MYCO|nr:aldo/keto reductase [Mycobacterium stomatepiae]BBY22019.1 hypothetical protein MSTO_22240 [Mycobacterium stomatepiae]
MTGDQRLKSFHKTTLASPYGRLSARSLLGFPGQVWGHATARSRCAGAAAPLGRTPAQVALAWTLSVAPNVLLIAGTSSLGHLEENLDVASIERGDATREQLNAVAA